jgi:hypothetical protein
VPSPITATVKTTGRGGAGTTHTTASTTPAANTLQLLTVANGILSGTASTPTVSGNGLTWVQVATLLIGTTRRLTLFRAMGASPSAGALTISYAGQSQLSAVWSLSQLANVDTSGTNGSGAVVASNTGTGTGTASSVDAGTLTDGYQQLFGANLHLATEGASSVLSELSDYTSGDAYGLLTAWGGDATTDTATASWATSVGYAAVALILQPNVLLGAGSTTFPTLLFQLSTSPPSGAPSWQDVTPYLVAGSFKRGRSFELDRVEAGTAEFRVLNIDRRFDPIYSGSPYYPNLVPLRRVRLLAEWNGLNYALWDGYIESIQQEWPSKSGPAAFATLKCTDAFEIMARRILTPSTYALTTSTGVVNGDLTYTARGSQPLVGAAGGGAFGYGWARGGQIHDGGITPLTVAYVSGGSNPPIDSGDVFVHPDQGTIVIQLQQATGQAQNIMNAVNANGAASQLVEVTLAPGSSGAGQVGPYGPVALVGEFVQERSDLRIKRVLDGIAWPTADRVLRTGTAIIQPTQFAVTDNMTALQHAQDVTATELGIFYIDGRNRAVFYDRAHRTVAPWNTPQAIFTDVQAEWANANTWPYQDLSPAFDSRYLYNRVTVTRNGGVAQTAQDATSIATFLTRELNISTLASSDAQSATTASALLARYKDIKHRYDSIGLTPAPGSGLWLAVLTFDISTRITVKRTPPGGGAAWVQDCYVEAVECQFDRHPQHWTTRWQLSPA